VDELIIVREEIDLCNARKIGLVIRRGGARREIDRIEFSISRVQSEIEVLEERLWWLRFLDFCNTSCWRFRV